MGPIESVWYGDGVAAHLGRGLLWPISRIYDAVVTARNMMYDGRVLPRAMPAIPVISVGNLTVGGTGKTPFAAWLASQLQLRGRAPAVVLRGYGADEPAVHRRLNPSVPVVVNPDRAAATLDAQRRGADVAILDDGFQHRRIDRAADIVLMSAEQLARPRRLLPAGPWREPLTSARRADLLVVTRKSADDNVTRRVLELLREAASSVPVAVVRLQPVQLIDATSGEGRMLARLKGARVVALTAIGEPDVFASQLRQLGANVTLLAYRDHHEFSDADLAAAAAQVGADGLAVCTLKDAVKLAHRWPPRSRLWYVSQQLVVEQGAEEIDRVLRRALDARTTTTTAAG